MEDRCRQGGVCTPLNHGRPHVLGLAGAARGDHRDRHRLGDGAGELEVITVPGAVAIHAREQYLPRAPLHALEGPIDGVAAGVVATAVAVDGPAASALATLGVDGEDETLRPQQPGAVGDQLRPVEGGGVDRGLVGARLQKHRHVLDGADTAAHSQRDENLVGGGLDHVDQDGPRVRGGGDVEKHQLVSPAAVVEGGQLHGVAGIA